MAAPTTRTAVPEDPPFAHLTTPIPRRSAADYAAPNTGTLRELPTAALSAAPWNPRRDFTHADIEELAGSLRRVGMLQPIVARPVEPPEGMSHAYQILAGHRRWTAAIRAGMKTVPVKVVDVDDRTAKEITIIENAARRDLNPIEAAEGYQLLLDDGMKQTELAAAVKVSQPTIAKAVGLLRLPEDVRDLIRRGRLSASHGEALLTLKAFPEACSAIAAAAAEHGWSTRETASPAYAAYDRLVAAGVAIQLGYGARFDVKAVCGRCPFHAMRRSDEWHSYCLKPEHYRELQAQARAAQEAQLAAARTVAPAGDGPQIRTADLPPDSYKDLGSYKPPAGCTGDCPCRAQALDGNGRVLRLCTDTRRYEQLKAKETKADNAAKRERVRTQITHISTHLGLLDQHGVPELAVLVHAAVANLGGSQRSREGLAQSVDRTVPGLLNAARVPSLDELATLAPLDLLRFGVDALLTNQLLTALDNEYIPPTAALWYGRSLIEKGIRDAV